MVKLIHHLFIFNLYFSIFLNFWLILMKSELPNGAGRCPPFKT